MQNFLIHFSGCDLNLTRKVDFHCSLKLFQLTYSKCISINIVRSRLTINVLFYRLPEVSKDVTEKLLQTNADHPNFTDLDIQKCENTINNQFMDFECGIRDIEDYLNAGKIIFHFNKLTEIIIN